MTHNVSEHQDRPDVVTGGVDTHRDFHVAAVLNRYGALLAHAKFPATAAGYAQLLDWLAGFGPVARVGVEGTGSYGAGLTRFLTGRGIEVLEVNRPDRAQRRRRGKSDPIDAENAARAVLAGTATATPKSGTGPVEAIRALKIERDSAKKARTAALNQMHNLVLTAPEPLRAQLEALTKTTLPIHCARLRPGTDLTDPTNGHKKALRGLARRVLALTAEIDELGTDLDHLVRAVAPTTTALKGAGPDTIAQLLITIGDNPDRFRNEAAFAALCGVSPVPASSGRTHRHRLNRGGDRHANSALHMITLSRLAHDPDTRAYRERRLSENLTDREAIRCLKRYLARRLFKTLRHDLRTLTHPHTTHPKAA
jgi:transposase